MKITDVQIDFQSSGCLKAFVNIVVEDCLVIKNMKIIQSSDKLFVSMPSFKNKHGQYQDIVHPINGKARRIVEEAVLTAYHKRIQDMASSSKAHLNTNQNSLSSVPL